MQITFTVIGKTNEKYLTEGIQIFEKRIARYINYKQQIIPDLKNTRNLSFKEIKLREGELLLKQLAPNDHVILLDEKGKTFTSQAFAQQLQSFMNRNLKHLRFVIGGAYGFSDAVYKRANGKIALSDMTFSHQMVRLIFTEQLYRAFSILNNEPYHHD